MTLPAACRQLMDLDTADVFDQAPDELRAAQLQAAQQLFEQRREQIAVLRQRANDEGIQQVRTLTDLVPLLFSHTTYKSYPESFIAAGRWELLTRWYATLSAVPVEVDLSGVKTVDEWVDRLWAGGHYLYATSGTTGKCSFLNHTAGDREFVERAWAHYCGWPNPWRRSPVKRRYYSAFVTEGPQAPMHWFKIIGELFGRPDGRFHLGRDPIRVSYLNRVGAMRRAMAAGTATPGDVAAFEDEMAARERAMRDDVRAMALDIFAHRDEPMIIQLWHVMDDILQIAREEGVAAGSFADVVFIGAARKRHRNSSLSAEEVRTQAMQLFAPTQLFDIYGMTELSTPMPGCEHGRYHVPPWIVLLPLDRGGTRLLEGDDGYVEGRAGFLDLSREGRWGGIITGDRIEVETAAKCECGRAGPVIRQTVSRYSDIGDDKVDCSGTFDAYVRGVMDGSDQ